MGTNSKLTTVDIFTGGFLDSNKIRKLGLSEPQVVDILEAEKRRLESRAELYGESESDFLAFAQVSSPQLEVQMERIANIRKYLEVDAAWRTNRRGVLYPISLKPIGCWKCEVQPCAKGLCRNCYLRNWRRNFK